MLHKAIAGVIVARLVLAPGAAADDPQIARAGRMYLASRAAEPSRATPIADASSREAMRPLSPPARGPMRPGLKWTGIGLIIGSHIPLVTTAMGGCRSSDRTCRNLRRVGYGLGATMAGTGALLIAIAHAKRTPAGPAIVIDGDRAVISQRITF